MIKRVMALLLSALVLLSCSAWAEGKKTYQLLYEENAGLVESENVKAFLEIPKLNFLVPVMQHPTDDGFYLKHNALGEESESGALYTQKTYNLADFSDPAVVIYGRRMDDRTMFGMLQEEYSKSFDELREIVLYLPGETRQYTVVAAVPFSNVHILYAYDFSLSRMFNAFFDEVYAVRRPGVQLDETLRPQTDENLLILSTGLRGDATQRYLVIAKINRTETN